ncbi:DegT/DnrJ/EryC1/StrS family aminotransferase [Pseudomonas sp. CT11-2]|jgi:perosamine synthetase|uniref:DegT/DnrJ/EryC1/StrS family aminotransferase n=1 Tax=unclassified Pseudomonas TaxID=196821 RepID=UPI0003629CED|nr:DegT/DnrJ/EryC1/StrS family aminotransferase [Pseudomonas sp. B21-019]UVM34620.1 DegT/DnrJ/EryC1/StrS family aminotransferase [Pseudomonas sp. B21-019]
MIPVYQPFLGGREKEYVNQCLDSTWISSRGEFISRFESEFARYIGAEHATTVSNGTVALHLAMAALGLGPGDEVIVPTLTYVASVNTIMQTGASVVYAESLADTWNVSVPDIRSRITPKTKAVMVVHLYGLACDMDEVVALCKEHNLLLIEDCAEAFGSLYKGQHVGTFGDVATFSFFGNKTITTGEGGMVVSKNKDIHERACHLKSQGVSKTREYWHDELAFNYRMTNICAAIGLAQLERADEIIALKRQVADWYREALEGLPLQMHAEQPGTRHSYWMCSILLDDQSQRQALRDHLKNKGIETRPLFAPAHHMPHCKTDESFPVAQDLSLRGVNLPSYPTLSREQVQQVVDEIRAYFAS